MCEEKIQPVLNETIVDKLDSISLDIKYYININYAIASSSGAAFLNSHKLMDSEDVEELLEIRERVKVLSKKLREKLKK